MSYTLACIVGVGPRCKLRNLIGWWQGLVLVGCGPFYGDMKNIMLGFSFNVFTKCTLFIYLFKEITCTTLKVLQNHEIFIKFFQPHEITCNGPRRLEVSVLGTLALSLQPRVWVGFCESETPISYMCPILVVPAHTSWGLKRWVGENEDNYMCKCGTLSFGFIATFYACIYV